MPGYSASRWHVEDYPHFTGSVAGAPVSLQVEMSCHPAFIQCKRTYHIHMRRPAANARRKMFPSNFGFRGEPDRIVFPIGGLSICHDPHSVGYRALLMLCPIPIGGCSLDPTFPVEDPHLALAILGDSISNRSQNLSGRT